MTYRQMACVNWRQTQRCFILKLPHQLTACHFLLIMQSLSSCSKIGGKTDAALFPNVLVFIRFISHIWIGRSYVHSSQWTKTNRHMCCASADNLSTQKTKGMREKVRERASRQIMQSVGKDLRPSHNSNMQLRRVDLWYSRKSAV